MSRNLPFLLVLVAVTAASTPAPLRVRASPVVSPCVAAAGALYERTTGRAIAVSTATLGDPASAEGADVVVAADAELNRIIESGASDPDLDVDVARIPWVLVGASGAAPDVSAVRRSSETVAVLGGVAAREARRVLARQGFASSRLRALDRAGGPVRLGRGETAIVPLSLAGDLPAASLSLPSITVRALGVRSSARADAVRAFLGFLTGEAGNAAFRACGRTESR
jgi:hypothetical protein